MFNIDAKPRFTTRCRVALPGEAAQEFGVTFEVAMVSTAGKLDLASGVDTAEFMRAVLKDVSEVEGADGKPIAFSPALVDKLIDNPIVRQALYRAYAEGLADAARGN